MSSPPPAEAERAGVAARLALLWHSVKYGAAASVMAGVALGSVMYVYQRNTLKQAHTQAVETARQLAVPVAREAAVRAEVVAEAVTEQLQLELDRIGGLAEQAIHHSAWISIRINEAEPVMTNGAHSVLLRISYQRDIYQHPECSRGISAQADLFGPTGRLIETYLVKKLGSGLPMTTREAMREFEVPLEFELVAGKHYTVVLRLDCWGASAAVSSSLIPRGTIRLPPITFEVPDA